MRNFREPNALADLAVKPFGTINYAVALLAGRPDRNRRDKRRNVCPVLSLDRFFASSLVSRNVHSVRLRGRGRGDECTTEKRNADAELCWCGHCSGRLRGALRLSFDVKHVRHEEYVNNANKMLFIARARARPHTLAHSRPLSPRC